MYNRLIISRITDSKCCEIDLSYLNGVLFFIDIYVTL